MKRDLADHLLAHLDAFQQYDAIKVYYDNGQQIVSNALHAAIDYALSKDAIIYRKSSPKDYRLEQAADFLCMIELTALKYQAGKDTATDRKVFCTWRQFKQNYLKPMRRKRIR